MNKINDGGPAFPVPLNPGQSYQGHSPCDGMTLRDYFAAKAMKAVWADIPEDANREQALRVLGHNAYEMADFMLAARGAQ